jgi:hypothetical protein
MREAAEKARLEAEAAAEVERLKAERIARLRALGLWDADGDPDEQLEEEVLRGTATHARAVAADRLAFRGRRPHGHPARAAAAKAPACDSAQ